MAYFHTPEFTMDCENYGTKSSKSRDDSRLREAAQGYLPTFSQICSISADRMNPSSIPSFEAAILAVRVAFVR
jgi:hypothetical protein